eukprot:gene13573-14977_t
MEHVATTRKEESIVVNTTQDENTRKDSMEEVDNEYIDIDINEEAKSKNQSSIDTFINFQCPASVSQCKEVNLAERNTPRELSAKDIAKEVVTLMAEMKLNAEQEEQPKELLDKNQIANHLDESLEKKSIWHGDLITGLWYEKEKTELYLKGGAPLVYSTSDEEISDEDDQSDDDNEFPEINGGNAPDLAMNLLNTIKLKLNLDKQDLLRYCGTSADGPYQAKEFGSTIRAETGRLDVPEELQFCQTVIWDATHLLI